MISVGRKQRRSICELQGIPLLAGCTAKQLARADRLGTEVALQAGHTLIREGEFGREFLIVHAGNAVATRGARRIGAIGAGSVAGELALLDGTARTATVVTTTASRVVVFTAREFEALLTVAPCIEDGVALIAAERRALLDRSGRVSCREC